jgi:hypothetical protein
MCEQVGIRQIPMTGGIVTHAIEWAWQVGMSRHVAMEALMECLQAEKVGRGSVGGDGPAPVPEEGWSIVGGGMDCPFPSERQ